jgi:hypothetical protein
MDKTSGSLRQTRPINTRTPPTSFCSRPSTSTPSAPLRGPSHLQQALALPAFLINHPTWPRPAQAAGQPRTRSTIGLSNGRSTLLRLAHLSRPSPAATPAPLASLTRRSANCEATTSLLITPETGSGDAPLVRRYFSLHCLLFVVDLHLAIYPIRTLHFHLYSILQHQSPFPGYHSASTSTGFLLRL